METIFVEKLVQKDGVWVWDPQPVQLDTETDFNIDEQQLNAEICKMGILLVKYGDLAADITAQFERKKEAVRLIQSTLGAAHRSQLETAGERPTVARLDELVLQDPRYQQALSELHVLRAATLKVEHWYRTACSKAKLLESLAFRQNAELRRAY